MDISGYYINGYWWIFHWLILGVIGGYYCYYINGYYINVYCWLMYYKLLLVIICYITTIGDYYIIKYC